MLFCEGNSLSLCRIIMRPNFDSTLERVAQSSDYNCQLVMFVNIHFWFIKMYLPVGVDSTG